MLEDFVEVGKSTQSGEYDEIIEECKEEILGYHRELNIALRHHALLVGKP